MTGAHSVRWPRDQFESRTVGELLCGVLEPRKHLKRILCAARQHDLVVDELYAGGHGMSFDPIMRRAGTWSFQ
jgi:hypothetical protein